MFQEYPKSLYRKSVDDHVIVNDAEEETKARDDGFEMFSEIHERENGVNDATAQESAQEEQADKPRRGRKPKAE